VEQIKERLRSGRIDGGSPFPVDIRINIIISEPMECFVVWRIAIWIDTMGLSPAIPNISIHVRREHGVRREEEKPIEDSKEKDGIERVKRF
jgi:hypothetical protein